MPNNTYTILYNCIITPSDGICSESVKFQRRDQYAVFRLYHARPIIPIRTGKISVTEAFFSYGFLITFSPI